MTALYLATDNGVWLWRDGQTVAAGLQGKPIGHVVQQSDEAAVLHAAVRQDGVYRTQNAGATWERVLTGDVWTLIHRNDRCEFVYAGMEPAGVHRSSDFGKTWTELDAVYRLPTYKQWWYPPPPHIAHVTSFVAHPHDVKTLYAGIEMGGVIVTHDGGRTWDEQHEGLQDDVHAMTYGPSPYVLYAATADGFHRSTDLGSHWQRCTDGMDRLYCYHIARVTGSMERLIISAATYYLADDSILFRSVDGGEHWQPAMEGMPSAQVNGRIYLAADPNLDGACFASLPDGRIMHSANAGESWQCIAQGLPHINLLTAF